MFRTVIGLQKFFMVHIHSIEFMYLSLGFGETSSMRTCDYDNLVHGGFQSEGLRDMHMDNSPNELWNSMMMKDMNACSCKRCNRMLNKLYDIYESCTKPFHHARLRIIPRHSFPSAIAKKLV